MLNGTPEAVMLAHSLAVVRCLRPDMPLLPRAVVEAILLSEGPIGSADEVARRLGLPNRFRLARLLKQQGLPPLHRLAEWATLESWTLAAERGGVSLCHIAFHAKRHPSACYRLVKELTGLGWEEVRVLGSAWVQNEFSNRLRRCGRVSDQTARPALVQRHGSSLRRSS